MNFTDLILKVWRFSSPAMYRPRRASAFKPSRTFRATKRQLLIGRQRRDQGPESASRLYSQCSHYRQTSNKYCHPFSGKNNIFSLCLFSDCEGIYISRVNNDCKLACKLSFISTINKPFAEINCSWEIFRFLNWYPSHQKYSSKAHYCWSFMDKKIIYKNYCTWVGDMTCTWWNSAS